MKMTYDKYDEMLELFEKLVVKPYYPDPTEIDVMYQDPDKWVMFACYLYEKNATPKNQAERYSRENLKMFIDKHLVLEDATCVNVELCNHPHGKISFLEHDSNKYFIGDICKLKIEMDSGYHIDEIYVLDGLFQKKKICDIDEDLSFVVPAMDVYVYVTFKENAIKDVV